MEASKLDDINTYKKTSRPQNIKITVDIMVIRFHSSHFKAAKPNDIIFQFNQITGDVTSSV